MIFLLNYTVSDQTRHITMMQNCEYSACFVLHTDACVITLVTLELNSFSTEKVSVRMRLPESCVSATTHRQIVETVKATSISYTIYCNVVVLLTPLN